MKMNVKRKKCFVFSGIMEILFVFSFLLFLNKNKIIIKLEC